METEICQQLFLAKLVCVPAIYNTHPEDLCKIEWSAYQLTLYRQMMPLYQIIGTQGINYNNYFMLKT